MPDEPRVQELLDELFDREATPEEVCGPCPELLPVVRKCRRSDAFVRGQTPERLRLDRLQVNPQELTIPGRDEDMQAIRGERRTTDRSIRKVDRIIDLLDGIVERQ